MAGSFCPSCGASWNGRRCQACNYEHFSEEIVHGGHFHKGEPLIVDTPVRKPIPRKDPFDCDRQTRKTIFPRKTKRPRPFVGLLTIFLLIYSTLPLIRNWGLELEAREKALRMEMELPEDLVALHEEGPVSIFTQPRYLTEFPDSGLRIWLKNDLKASDIYITDLYVMADGFVLPNAGLYVEASADTYGMGTLYLDGDNLKDAGIRQVRELSFVLECLNDDYTTLFVTDPITITREVTAQHHQSFDGHVLIDQDGIVLKALGTHADPDDPKFENGWMLFYAENNTDEFLSMNSLDVTVGGREADLYLWSNLPAKSRAVVRLDLWGLRDLDFETPSQLGDLDMTVEFWNRENDDFSREYSITMPMVNTDPVVIQ